MRATAWVPFVVGICIAAAAGPLYGLDAENVLVLYNDASADGQAIATYYSQARPGVRLLALEEVAPGEVISADGYLQSIRQPVLNELVRLTGESVSIDCIVTTRGLPLRIDNPLGLDPYRSRYSSLESELTRIDTIDTTALMANQSMMPPMFGGNPLVLNPYYAADEPFSFAEQGIRLTSRLDGFSVADVQGSIDRAQHAVAGRNGSTVLMDDHPGNYSRMAELNDVVVGAADLLGAGAACYDTTSASILDLPPGKALLGYVGHGVRAGLPESYLRDAAGGLAPPIASGAIFHTYESFNAYTFAGDLDSPSPKNQGLIAQWIARGGTAGVGHVEEPGATDPRYNTNEDRMFAAMVAGRSFAEAAWSATFQLSFVNTVVGDPLMVYEQRLHGDTDSDGDVDFDDFLTMQLNWGGTDRLWPQGDFNGDSTVNFDDIVEMLTHWTGSTPVPEPGTLALLWCGAMALPAVTARRRRRRAQ